MHCHNIINIYNITTIIDIKHSIHGHGKITLGLNLKVNVNDT